MKKFVVTLYEEIERDYLVFANDEEQAEDLVLNGQFEDVINERHTCGPSIENTIEQGKE